MNGALPSESRDVCPLLKCMADVLISIKETNNRDILEELGMLPCGDITCQCRMVRKT